MYMEMSQGNTLYNYFKQKNKSFFFYKNGEQEGKMILYRERGLEPVKGRGYKQRV
jgi:hypothetical protein